MMHSNSEFVTDSFPLFCERYSCGLECNMHNCCIMFPNMTANYNRDGLLHRRCSSFLQEVREAYTYQTMNETTAHLAPQQDVDALISQVADEHAIDVGDIIDSASAVREALISRNKVDQLAE